MLEAGLCKYVLISYGHNAASSDSMKRYLLERSGNEPTFGFFGAVGGYAMAARRAMHILGTGPDTWKHIAVGQRKWANLNPLAYMYDKIINYDDYENSKFVVEPLRLLDCCLLTDGGRAIIVTSAERARELPHPLVLIMGMGQYNISSDAPYNDYLAGPTGAKEAARQAFNMAGIVISDIDACQIYDCFTYTVEITLQDYGFFKPGEGKDWLKDGTIEPSGKMPVNTSGGQLSETYFMGLTQISEAVMQLMGRCGKRQLGSETGTKSPEIIICSDNGGILQTHSCIILRKD